MLPRASQTLSLGLCLFKTRLPSAFPKHTRVLAGRARPQDPSSWEHLLAPGFGVHSAEGAPTQGSPPTTMGPASVSHSRLWMEIATGKRYKNHNTEGLPVSLNSVHATWHRQGKSHIGPIDFEAWPASGNEPFRLGQEGSQSYITACQCMAVPRCAFQSPVDGRVDGFQFLRDYKSCCGEPCWQAFLCKCARFS